MQQNTNDNQQYSQFHILFGTNFVSEKRVPVLSWNPRWWVAPGPRTRSDPYLSDVISILHYGCVMYGSAEGPPRGVENRNLLSHPDDLRMEAYVIRMT